MDKVGYGYALAVTAGGVMGYVKKGSAVSLAMGVLFGTLSAVGAYQISQDRKNVWLLLVNPDMYLAAVASSSSTTLAAVMGSRALRSGKFMPAGMIASLSSLVVLGLVPTLIQ